MTTTDRAQAKKAVVESYIDAIAEGDPERLGEFIADDIVVHIPGNNPIAGDYRGRDEVLTYYRTLVERTQASGGSVEVDMHDLLASDEHVVSLSRRRFAGVDARAIVVYHVEDGKIQETWVHELAQDEVDRALNEAWVD